MWKGPCTVIDKCGPVDYKIQLIGGTQLLVVRRNCLKPCYGAPSPVVSSTPTPAPTSSTFTEHVEDDLCGIGGYTTVPTAAHDDLSNLPIHSQCNHHHPVRYVDYVLH